MSFYRRRFNLYLLPAALVLLLSGCALWHKHHSPPALLRIHVQSESAAAGASKTISLMRSQPVMVNVAADPILTEGDVVSAKLVENPGGFMIQVTFDETAGWSLEQYTAANPGKHLVIFGQWSDKLADGRWLAAPGIARRLAGGVVTFTPDATREEAEKLVEGLNKLGKENVSTKEKE